MGKRGRPAEDEPKNVVFNVRMSDKDVALLNNLAEKTGTGKGEIMRRALKMYYNLAKNR